MNARHEQPGIRSSLYQPLSEADVRRVAEDSFRILEESGMLVFSKTAREAFRRAGADVNETDRVVKLPRSLVEDAIDSNPSSLTRLW